MCCMSSFLEPSEELPSWTFFSNHAHVLVCIAKQSDMRLGDIARRVGIRERTVHRIIQDLAESGYITVLKDGRNNVYEVNLNRPLRHPLEADHDIRAVISPLLKKSKAS